jgi:hypothetical protein
MVFSALSDFVPGAGENNRIWSQGKANVLDHVSRANAIIFKVQFVILGTPCSLCNFIPNAFLMQILGPLGPYRFKKKVIPSLLSG